MTKLEQVEAVLRRSTTRLYAVLDGAQSTRIQTLLQAASDRHQSLYDGLEGEMLAPFGPYLVELDVGSSLLTDVLAAGWGKSWGIFVCSPAAFRHVRRHLRRFLKVTTEAGSRVYFRFYDPRVLRAFMPTRTERQAELLFGEVESFVMEDDAGDRIVRFTRESPMAASIRL